MTDCLEELENLAPSIADAIAARNLGHNLERARAALSDAPRQTKRFIALVDAAMLLDAVSSQYAKADLLEAVEESEFLGRKLEQAKTADDIDMIVVAYPDFAKALVKMDRVVRRLWDDVVEREFRPLQAVGELLIGIEKTKDLGGRLVEIGTAAANLAGRRDPAEELVPELRRLREARDALQSQWRALTQGPEVDGFLSAVATRSATLADATPNVLKWLKENGALSRFSVRVI